MKWFFLYMVFFQKYKCQQAVVSVRNIRDVFITENPVRRTERKSVRQKWGMRERERERDRRTDCVCVCVCVCVCERVTVCLFNCSTWSSILWLHRQCWCPRFHCWALLRASAGKKHFGFANITFWVRFDLFLVPNSHHWLSPCCGPADQDAQTNRAVFW